MVGLVFNYDKAGTKIFVVIHSRIKLQKKKKL
jgi:hypothetical protein